MHLYYTSLDLSENLLFTLKPLDISITFHIGKICGNISYPRGKIMPSIEE
jgi:hypothetical protein